MSDSQLVQLLENMLLTPSSDFYLSKILYNADGSALDPRTIAAVDLGSFSLEGVPIDIVIKKLNIRGLSNSQVKFDSGTNPEIVVDGSTVTFHAKQPNTQDGYQRPATVPNQILANGELHVTLDHSDMPPGTISLTINHVDDLTGVFSATEAVDGQLDTTVVNFSSLSINPVIGNGNLTIVVDLDTVFKATINQLLNEDANQKKIIDALNSEISNPDLLASLSQIATQEARKALANI
ncbi:hypothetical protein EXW72_04455 [Pseudomonas sp. BCA14]|uniref:hypothetical protein n=1 Tax=Pseudomonas TaxID=286 RepID=UPI000CD58696|nr:MULTISPECIES: hypothetical protein [Pseudomonas]RBH56711.1 hypothetical protein C3F00_015515 [Pseudomonas sp. MWU13-2860]TFF14443.1 hypothetical protein EXW70_08030 [Pseudomonas sp. JMN1]TFF14873.1 hypothetical protein EXW71_01010 [Pseudomonas sp. BCA17]TFF31279.1 hypothetical protein EXW72_04455 [Pseudomonas sp. BCA14]TFF32233.1 hypothetical protein EXW73_00260 [Pseudomonas sp. BCA13]